MPIPDKFKLTYDEREDKNDAIEKPYEDISDKEFEWYKKYEYYRGLYTKYVNYLNSMSKNGYGRNDDGMGPKPMDKEAVDVLERLSVNLLICGNKVTSLMNIHVSERRQEAKKKVMPEGEENTAYSEFEKNIRVLMYDINLTTNRAAKDISMLSTLDTDHPENLPSYISMHRQATETVIDAGNVKLQKVGDAMSSRMVLRYMDENGNIQKGFFTKDVTTENMHPSFEMGKTESLNQRNTAMSDVATLLGMDNLLAKSTNMVVMINGKPVHGNFMANAKGFDAMDIKPDSSFFNGQPITVDYNRVVKSCTDMMLLDYICGNCDRHHKNHFYQFEYDKNGLPMLVGFQGIDNDQSFIGFTPKFDTCTNKLTALKNIRHISEETKKRIMNLSDETLTAMLSHNDLGLKAIEACIERLHMVQFYINGKYLDVDENNKQKLFDVENPITIKKEFTEDDFNWYNNGYVNRKDIDITGTNPINNFKFVEKTMYNPNLRPFAFQNIEIEKAGEKIKKEALDKKCTPEVAENTKRKYIELEYRTRQTGFEIKERINKIGEGVKGLQHKLCMDVNLTIKAQSKRFNEQFKKFWKPGEGDIPEYGKMYNAVKELNEYLKEMARAERKGLVNDIEQNILADKYKDVEKAIRDYIPAVNTENIKKNDRKRIVISTRLQELCDAGREQREFMVNEFNELMGHAARQVGKDTQASLEAARTCRYVITDTETNEERLAVPKEPKDQDIKYRLASSRLTATQHLASYIGNIIPPEKSETAKVKDSMATLLLTSRLQALKEKEPDVYNKMLENLGEKPDSLAKAKAALLKDKNFAKLAENVRAPQMLNEKVRNSILKQAETFHCFDGVEKKARDAVKKNTPAQNVKK